MVQSYSEDFRQRAVDAYELDGYRKTQVCEMFHISRNTLDLWLKLKAETGSLSPRKRRPTEPKGIIKDWDKFRQFVKDNSGKTQEEMAELWEDDISSRTICRALKKIGFTRKKDLWVQGA